MFQHAPALVAFVAGQTHAGVHIHMHTHSDAYMQVQARTHARAPRCTCSERTYTNITWRPSAKLPNAVLCFYAPLLDLPP